MDINDVELPDFIIAELYKNNLIAGATLPPASVSAAKALPSPDTVSTASADPTPLTPAADPVTPSAANTLPFAGPYKFLGTNRKKITILVQSPGITFLPDEQLTVLTKMLEACKMNMGDVALVNHATLPVKIAALRQQLAPRMILLFGLPPIATELPINFPQFKIQAYDQCTYLCAPSLEEMIAPGEASKLIKTRLWSCLKELFGV
ncbi:MAG TPA: hypothetical protein VK563_12770 [Puia sp.]|nr:hypothetical protein [Puia sp.]